MKKNFISLTAAVIAGVMCTFALTSCGGAVDSCEPQATSAPVAENKAEATQQPDAPVQTEVPEKAE